MDWWRHAVIYQIYPRSFADGDGDGVGDLPGITARLDHVAELGADAVWLSPFYVSPHADAGYDVADYRAVDPLFGTLDDADALIARAHELGPAGDRRPRAQPHLRRARVVPGGARGRTRQPRTRPLRLPRRAGRGRRRAAQQLVQRVRGPGLDPDHRARRIAGPVVPAPVRRQAAGPGLDQPRGPRGVPRHPALLAAAGRGRVPRRRRPRAGQGRRPCPTGGTSRATSPPSRPGSPRRCGTRTTSTRSTGTGAGCWRSSTATACWWPRRGSARCRGWPGTCAPTRCTRRSTSPTSRRRGAPPTSAR